MCDDTQELHGSTMKTTPVQQAVGTVLAHDITEIRPGEFKGRAFKKGHIIRQEDVCHLQRLGKEHLFVLKVADDELHENAAAYTIAKALMGDGVAIKCEPHEGKISIIAAQDGLLKIDRDALLAFNMVGEVMCASLHDNSVVIKGQTVAETRAIPLVVKKTIIAEAVRRAECSTQSGGVIQVKEIRKPRAGVVITGNEVYHGHIKDAFAPVIAKKIKETGGDIVGVYYAPDDKSFIVDRLRELLNAGADLLITTGGMSVDPDDVTRFAISNLGARDITYGSAALPGAMVLVAYLDQRGESKGQEPEKGSHDPGSRTVDTIPILGIPACAMYAKTTVFDLILPRVLAGEKIGRRELAQLGHGSLCMQCEVCKYPVCPFGKS